MRASGCGCPSRAKRPARLASVLHAIYLTFTEGHWPHGTSAVVRDDLCEEALRLARRLHRLVPDEPEVTGLLALILLTSARSAARAGQDGALILLADQDRSRWERDRPAEGQSLAETALAQHRPGPYQLQAAIAACHADAATAAGTDWRQIAALYGELLRFDPSPVIEANRAVAVAYAEGRPHQNVLQTAAIVVPQTWRVAGRPPISSEDHSVGSAVTDRARTGNTACPRACHGLLRGQ